MKIEVGTSYYPENWTRERIIRDAELMKNAGLSYVRMGEFAWSHMEPEEGKFQFEWLEEAIRIFGEQGIRSVLCTPSAAAPAWLCKKHPSILRMDRNGDKAYFGIRHHTCYTSKIYRKYVKKITTELADYFKDDPYIAAWQIENEPGATPFSQCFCEDCQIEFRQYLHKRYQTIEALNQAWRAQFWSGEYTCWDEIELNELLDNQISCRGLETRRFRSRIQAEFVHFQAAIIRDKMPDTMIGTNNYCLSDRYEVFSSLDFAGNDVYPNYRSEETMMLPYINKMACTLYSGLKPGTPPWIMETPPNPGWPMKDLTKFFFWLYAGYGYNKIFYFPWGNAMTSGEKIHLSVVDAFGNTGPQYESVKSLIAEADQVLAPYPELPLPHSPCAIIRDHDAEWMYGGCKISWLEQYYKMFCCSYISLCKNVDFAEIVSKDTDWSAYKLIVLPVQNHISKSLAEKMKNFVKNGGILIMNGASGCFDEYGNQTDCIHPEHVNDLFGLEIGENMPCNANPPVFENNPEFYRKRPVVKGVLNGKEVRGTFSVWTSYLRLTGAKTLLSFENSQLAGLPFCTINDYGKGAAIYYNANYIDQELCDQLIRFATEKAGLTPISYPEDVSIIKRGNLAFLFHFGEEQVEFSTTLRGKNRLGNALHQDKIKLSPQDIALIELETEQ